MLTFVRELLVDSPQLGDPGIGRRRGQRGIGVLEIEAALRAVGSCFSHFCGSCMGSCNDMVGRQNPQPYVLARFAWALLECGAVLLHEADFRRGFTIQKWVAVRASFLFTAKATVASTYSGPLEATQLERRMGGITYLAKCLQE